MSGRKGAVVTVAVAVACPTATFERNWHQNHLIPYQTQSLTSILIKEATTVENRFDTRRYRRSHSSEKSLTLVESGNACYHVALKYSNNRLSERRQHYNDVVASWIVERSRRVKVQLSNGFSDGVRHEWSTNWGFIVAFHFIKETSSGAALNTCTCLSRLGWALQRVNWYRVSKFLISFWKRLQLTTFAQRPTSTSWTSSSLAIRMKLNMCRPYGQNTGSARLFKTSNASKEGLLTDEGKRSHKTFKVIGLKTRIQRYRN